MLAKVQYKYFLVFIFLLPILSNAVETSVVRRIVPAKKKTNIDKETSANAVPKISVHRIILDPGHGGKSSKPVLKFGEKYDWLTQRYLTPYRGGASYGGMTERVEMLKLARKVRWFLNLCNSRKGFLRFTGILKKYSHQKIFKRVAFKIMLTRSSNYSDHYAKNYRGDLNALYRHTDFLDARNKRRRKGRLTRINDFQPELILSLHLTPGEKGGGMAAVITPSYKVYNWARQYVLFPKKRKRFYAKWKSSHWNHWMIFTHDRSRYKNFVTDAWVYFTGYWSKPSGWSVDLSKNRGYRWNSLSWAYNDPAGWVTKARAHKPGLYARTMRQYKPTGRFFDRERADPEKWRRSGGAEGYGGDNYYAAKELMRYVQYGLRMNAALQKKKIRMGPIRRPFVSTWEIPILTNAISAYLEIAYINSANDRKNLRTYNTKMAEALAVGIYSLYSGLQVKKSSSLYVPTGKILNFKKYRMYHKGNYFKLSRLK